MEAVRFLSPEYFGWVNVLVVLLRNTQSNHLPPRSNLPQTPTFKLRPLHPFPLYHVLILLSLLIRELFSLILFKRRRSFHEQLLSFEQRAAPACPSLQNYIWSAVCISQNLKTPRLAGHFRCDCCTINIMYRDGYGCVLPRRISRRTTSRTETKKRAGA